jgi:hypothetical protein
MDPAVAALLIGAPATSAMAARLVTGTPTDAGNVEMIVMAALDAAPRREPIVTSSVCVDWSTVCTDLSSPTNRI